ncbi:TPA: hypothetical protein N0F65_002067 [Lagenidium giganteum]|uniref:Multiple C2 domain-containing protein n=1 Tax=Lagenidium giganteum TaxID=4803 RepID=A0AAV2ZEE1_9STRA|nr:TPA: hypothetical protein N0F65_002067 [Lagenidium giganteum]
MGDLAFGADKSDALEFATTVPSLKPGILSITMVRAEKLPISQKMRIARATVSVRMLPYDEVFYTPPAMAPNYVWQAPITLRHYDVSKQNLMLQVIIFDDPPLAARSPVAVADVSLREVAEQPGLAISVWVALRRLDDILPTSTGPSGRILLSMCFHPKIIAGPTLSNLLAEMKPQNQSLEAESMSKRRRKSTRWFQRGSKKNQNTVMAALLQNGTRKIKGTLSFCLRGIHLCGPQCSKIDGHTTICYPDFAPIVRVKCGEFEQEIRLGATECDAASFEHEWPVFSSFSEVEVEVLKKVPIAAVAGTLRRLNDGSQATRVCALSISCHAIQERDAASWTLDPPECLLGPGKNRPRSGFNWYSLVQGEEEIGLAHIRANYQENFSAIIDTEEGADLSYVYPDEKNFDSAIIQRNVERLDDFFSAFREGITVVNEILEWKYPVRTAFLWMAINISCLYFPTAHLPLVALLGVAVGLIVNYVRFLFGHTHKKWIQRVPGNSRLKTFRPVATLRLVPVRAANLRLRENHTALIDAYVKIFYEPNYKNIPVHLIAQTECARRTRSPIWAVSQRDSGNKEDFLRMNNNWLKEMVRHLNTHEQDAILHDVVEPWQRADGTTDTHAFKYPILQPVQREGNATEEDLILWRNCPGAIRFDVMHEGSAGTSTLIGRVRVPIKSLVGNESAGGPQPELEQTFALAVPTKRHDNAPPNADDECDDAERSTSTLTVRMQLLLRDPKCRVTLKETLASEALYDVIEMENEKELTLVEKYHKAKDVAKNIQQTLGQVCSTIERLKNLFCWVHPKKTLFILILTLLGCVWCYFVPMKFMVLYVTAKWFTKKFHEYQDRDFVRFQNLLSSIPSDLDLKKIYHLQNQEFLRMKEHTEAQAKLQAQWAGSIWKQGDGVLNSWQERYAAVRSGRMEIWQCMADAKSGIPPKSTMLLSNVVETCTKMESSHVPRDTYPIVVFDVSRHFLMLAPRGRRRVICAKSETAVQSLIEAIHETGEKLRSTSKSVSQ